MLDVISDFCTRVTSFFETLAKGFVLGIRYLVDAISLLYSVISNLPSPFVASATVLIAVCVLYKILGRESRG